MRGCRRRYGPFCLFAVLCALAVPSGALASSTSEAGRTWLLGAVAPDGAWRSPRDPEGLRSTARVVAALGGNAPLASRLWLAAQPARSLEDTAAAAWALGLGTTSTLLSPVASHRVEPGRWTGTLGHLPDPYHTALALLASSTTEAGTLPEFGAGAEYLIAAQNADGSWSAAEVGQETAVTTAVALHALIASGVPATASAVTSGRQWLSSHQNLDGGWGLPGSTPAVTAQVLSVLRWLGVDQAAEQAAVAYLEGEQGWDGSWESDPWTTALATTALSAAGLPDLGFAVGSVVPSPDPVPGDAWALEITVANHGSMAAWAAEVRFQVTDGSGVEVSGVSQTLDAVAPGETVPLRFPVDTSVLDGSYTWSVDLDPSDILREGDETDNHRDGPLSVGGWRNLSVVAGSLGIWTADGLLQLDPSALTVGVAVLVKARVSVEGTHGAGPVEVWMYWDDPADGLLVGSTVIDTIPPDGVVDVAVPWTVDTQPGPGSLTVVVDPRGLVGQTETATDRADLAVAVGAEDVEPPGPPTALAADLITKDEVDVTWQAPAAPDVVGYRLYRNGLPVTMKDLAPTSTPSASDSYNLREYLPEPWRDRAAFDPPNMTDGDMGTAWWSIMLPYEEWEPEKTWVQYGFGRPESFRGIVIHWWNFDVGGEDFRLQAWDGQAWVDLHEVRDNVLDKTVILLDQAVVTEKVRVAIDRGPNRWFTAIREVTLYEAGPGRVVGGTSYVDTTLPMLPATYTVTAVDAAGNESAPSEPFVLEDRTPPVVEITTPVPGQRVGPEVVVMGTVNDDFLQGYAFEWVEGEHLDDVVPQWNRWFQRAEPVVDGHLFTWYPPKNVSGPYTLRVFALDGGGVDNIRETRVLVNVDTVPPARPEALVTSQEDDRVHLTWQPNAEPDLAGYIVTVNGTEPGLGDVVDQGTASAADEYADEWGSHPAGDAVDGKPWTYWRPSENGYPYTWRLDFAEPQRLQQVVTQWAAPMVPRRFRVETRGADGTWVVRWSTDANSAEKRYANLGIPTSVRSVRIVVEEGVVLAPESDAAGEPAPYPALAEVSVLAEGVVTDASFDTVFEDKQEVGLTVEAVDDLGNRSSVSQAAVVDFEGPRVALYAPIQGESLGRAVTVRGIADDRYFKEYVVEVGAISEPGEEPATWEELHRSMTPIGPTRYGYWMFGHVYGGMYPWNQVMTVWYPTVRKGLHVVRLTAWDRFGHASVARAEFTLDAMPPEAPGNLALAQGADGVSLTWNPSIQEFDGSGPADDLAGYRVYRDGIPLTVTDVAFLGKVDAPTFNPWLQGLPQYLADGNPTSGWMPMPFAQSAEIVVGLPQPYEVSKIGIDWWRRAEWLWGRDFDVDVWDDAAQGWVSMARVTDRIAPTWEVTFAPTVTDRVRITLRKGPTRYSLGAIEEIHIVRTHGGERVVGTTYSDSGRVAVETAYRVTALDTNGNESTKSNRVYVDPVPPRVAITSPDPGEYRQPAGSCVSVRGTVDDVLLREYRVEVGRGQNPLFWEELARRVGDLVPIQTPSHLADWKLPDREQGWFTFRVVALDEGDQQSEDRVSIYIDTLPPNAPTGLVAAAQDGGVQLDWNAVVDTGLAGYHIYRNGKRLDLPDIAAIGVPKASSYVCDFRGCYPPENAIDGSSLTEWVGMDLQIPAWVRLNYDGFFPITGITIDWNPWLLARDFQVQRWDRAIAGWVDLADVTWNDTNPSEITFPEPVRVERLRVRPTGFLDGRMNFGIRELHLWRAPGAETPQMPSFFDDAVAEFEYAYRVTAVDDFGNESIPSNEVPVDDRFPRVTLDEPPEGQRVGAHVEVRGTVEEWRLLEYRLEVGKGEAPTAWEVAGVWEKPVEDNVAAVWDPPTGEDGPWRIRLVARDLSGQETEVERGVWVDTTPPPVPTNLVASIVGAGTVNLDWGGVSAADLAGFNVYRAGVLLNDADVTGWGMVTANWRPQQARNAIDDDLGTRWLFWDAPMYPLWEESFPGDVTIDQVEVYWGGLSPALDYEFQVWDVDQWKTVEFVWDNRFFHRIHFINVPAAADKFRILITRWDRNQLASLEKLVLRDNARGVPVPEPHYADQGLTEIGWSYQVSAVDDLGNESVRTVSIMVDDAAPTVTLATPVAGAVVTGPLEVTGTATDANLAHWRVEVGVGETPVEWGEVAFGETGVEGGVFTIWTPPADTVGPYALRLTATDRSGKESGTTVVVQVHTLPPPPPDGLVAAADPSGGPNGTGTVTLTWNPPVSGEVAGYNVYRDGEKLNRVDLAPLATVSASSWMGVALIDEKGVVVPTGRPEHGVDGNPATVWAPKGFLFPAWYALEFNQQYWIQGVVTDWFQSMYGGQASAGDYQIQVKDGGEWRPVVFVENNKGAHRPDTFPEPVTTDGIRIFMTRGAPWHPWYPGAISEIQVVSAEAWDLLAQPTFTDSGRSVVEGVYTVTAVDAYGRESQGITEVVDDVPPRISVTSPAEGGRLPRRFTVEGSVEDGTLSEVEVAYRLEGGEWQVVSRHGELPRSGEVARFGFPWQLSYDGPAELRVRAWDRGGNVAEQVVPVLVDTLPPDPPTGVTVTALGTSAAQIGWTPSPSADVVGYLVQRGSRIVNPGNLLEQAVASASDVYLDSEYHQPWAALDAQPDTAWWSDYHNGPKIFEAAFPNPTLIDYVKIVFDGTPFAPICPPLEFEVEAVIGGRWVVVADGQGPPVCQSYPWSTRLFPAVLTDRVRVVTPSSTLGSYAIGIREMDLRGPGVVADTTYVDSDLDAAETVYRVIAQDQMGNRSVPSAPAYLDTVPPRVALTSPSESVLVGASVRITGTVEDPNLSGYELSWGAGSVPDAWTTLETRGAYNRNVDHSWDASGLEGAVTVRLRAWDGTGNEAEDRVTFQVDGNTPAAPVDLVATAGEGGMSLSWSAAPEGDVLGYLVYRDGILLTTDDITPFGKAWALSGGSPDKAIDDSESSTWVNDDSIEGPVMWGIDFPEPFEVAGVDLQFVDSLYLAHGAYWHTVPSAIVIEGWRDYEWVVLATISDNVSVHRVAAFAQTTVRRLRLRFLAADGFPPRVNLSDVQIRPAGPTGRVAETTFSDPNLFDPSSTEHVWTLVAVDAAGNESAQSELVRVDRVSPGAVIHTPRQGQRLGAHVEVTGTVTDKYLETCSLEVQLGDGLPASFPCRWDHDTGAFTRGWDAPLGWEGPVVFHLTAIDAAGNEADDVVTVTVDTVAPGVPEPVTVARMPEGVRLGWDPPADDDVAGYLVYRDGEPLNTANLARAGTLVSEGITDPEYVADGLGPPAGIVDQHAGSRWWGVVYDTPHTIAAVDVPWSARRYGRSPLFSPPFDIQVRRGGRWLTAKHLASSEVPRDRILFDPPVVAEGVRIVIDPDGELDPDDASITLAEVIIHPVMPGLVTGSSYIDSTAAWADFWDGGYRVAAVDDLGNVGPLSVPVTLHEGAPDVAIASPLPGMKMPGAVVIEGTVKSPILSGWSLEASVDTVTWETVATGSQPVEGETLGGWRAPDGYGGSAILRLTARDHRGGESSTLVPFVVDADPPAAPTGFREVVGPTGTVFAWDANVEPDLAGYRVYCDGHSLTGNPLPHGVLMLSEVGSVIPVEEDGTIDQVVSGDFRALEATFAFELEVSAWRLSFAEPTRSYPLPSDLALQVERAGGWQTVAEVPDNPDTDVVLSADPPVRGHRFRVVMRRPNTWSSGFLLQRVEVVPAGVDLVDRPTISVEGGAPPEDTCTVTALDDVGNESLPYAAVSAQAPRGVPGAAGGHPRSFFPLGDGTFLLWVDPPYGETGQHLLQVGPDGTTVAEWTLPEGLDGIEIEGARLADGGGRVFWGRGDGEPTVHVALADPGGAQRGSFVLPYGGGPGRVATVTDLVATSGRLYVVEPSEIEVFDEAGIYLETWTFDQGEDPGEVGTLRGAACDRFGRLLLVSDSRVLIYSLDGTYRGEFPVAVPGSRWPVNGDRIAVDLDGNIAVSVHPWFGTGVYVFNADGSFVADIDACGDVQVSFDSIRAIAFDDDGTLWVLDESGGGASETRMHPIALDLGGVRPTVGRVALTSPAQDGVVASESWVMGRVELDSPGTWTLSVGAGASPVDWIVIGGGDVWVPSGVLGRWKTTTEPDGVYTVRLRASTDGGDAVEVRHHVVVDTAPPVLALGGLADHAVLAPGVFAPITTTLADEYPAEYRLKYYDIHGNWVTLDSGEVFPEGGIASYLDTSPLPLSTYRVKLWALDAAGNLSASVEDFSLDPVQWVATGVTEAPWRAPSAASPDGILAVATKDGKRIRLFDDDLALQEEWTFPQPLGAGDLKIDTLGFSPAGELIAVAGQRMVRWSPSGEVSGVFDSATYGDEVLGGCRGGVAVGSQGRVLCMGGSPTRLGEFSFWTGSAGRWPLPAEVQGVGLRLLGTIGQNPVIKWEEQDNHLHTIHIAEIDGAGSIVRQFERAYDDRYENCTDVRLDDEGDVLLAWGSAFHYSDPEVEKCTFAGETLWLYGGRGGSPGRFGQVAVTSPFLVQPGRDGIFYVVEPPSAGLSRLHSFRALDDAVVSPPPVVTRIESPANGLSVPGGGEVVGSAWNEPSTVWTLEVGPGENPSSWTFLNGGTGPVVSTSLGGWDASGLSDGLWTLRLTATGGWEPQQIVRATVRLDTHPPVATIEAPATGSAISGVVQLAGTVSDEELTEFVLSYQGESDLEPVVFARGFTGVEDDVLATWDTTVLPTGPYTLRLEATDRAGNHGAAQVEVFVGKVVFAQTLAAAEMEGADGLVRLPDGRWVLPTYGKIQVFSPAGQVLQTITSDDVGQPIGSVRAIAATPTGGFAVLAPYRERITVFDSGGQAALGFTQGEGSPVRFRDAVGLAVDGAGRILVLCRNRDPYEARSLNGYHVFDVDGTYLFSVTGYGDELGSFREPVGIGVDGAGCVYVLDRALKRVQVFDPAGNFLTFFPVDLSVSPASLAVANDGTFLVVAPGAVDPVLFYAPTGGLLGAWGGSDGGAGSLQNPLHAWLSNDLAALYEQDGSKVVVYDVSGLRPDLLTATAAIGRPSQGAPVPARFRVLGTAAGPGVAGYGLSVGVGDAPDTWVTVSSNDRPVINGVLGVLDLSGYPSGGVSIRLTVNTAGGTVEQQIVCRLDSISPTVEIVSPGPYGRLQEGDPVIVTVTDEGAVTHEVLMGHDDGVGHLVQIARGEGSLASAPVDWSIQDFPPGVYRIVLMGVDDAGNRTTVDRFVSTGELRYVGRFPLGLAESEHIKGFATDGDGLLLATDNEMRFLDEARNRTAAWYSYNRNLRDVTVTPEGVAELDGDLVRLVDRQGGVVRAFDTSAPENGGLSYPNWISMDSNGRFLVQDGSRIGLYDVDGAFLDSFPSNDVSTGVGADGYGNWYYPRDVEPPIEVLRPPDVSVLSMGTYGTGPGQISRIAGLDVDPVGHVAVLGNDKLSVLTPDGHGLGELGGWPNAEGWPRSGYEVRWGSKGRAYVRTYRDILIYEVPALVSKTALPEVAIDSPQEDGWGRETFPVVGTAAGVESYVLTLEGPEGATPIASRPSPVADGILGMVDASALPEGPYTLRLTGTGPAGTAEVVRSIRIDAQPPVAEWISPEEFARIDGPTAISARVSDTYLSNWTLKFVYWKPPYYDSPWDSRGVWEEAVLAQGVEPVAGELAVLDPSPYPGGTHLLRLEAEDSSGHVAVAERAVNLGISGVSAVVDTVPGIAGGNGYPEGLVALADGSFLVHVAESLTDRFFHVAPDGTVREELPFSPPVSGQSITMVWPAPQGFGVLLWGSGGYFAEVFSVQGDVVASFALPPKGLPGHVDYPKAMVVAEDRVLVLDDDRVQVFDFAGTHLATWGERGDDPGEFAGLIDGALDPFGRVLILDGDGRLLTYDLDGTYRGETFLADERGVRLGNGAEALSAGPRGNVAVLLRDHAYLYRADGVYLSRFGYSGTGPAGFDHRAGATFGPDGTLWVQRYVEDPYGEPQGRMQGFSFDLDDAAAGLGRLAFVSPAPGDVVPGQSWVVGRVAGAEPLSWVLSVGPGETPANWRVLAQGNRPVPLGVLGTWRTTPDEGDGTYTLRLTLDDAAGTHTESTRVVVLDATPPDLGLDDPPDLAVLQGGLEAVRGTLWDEHPDRFEVKYLDENESWAGLAESQMFPSGRDLAFWDTTVLPNGTYRLKAWALDEAGNLSTVSRDISLYPVEFLKVTYVEGWSGSNVPVAASRDGRIAVASSDRGRILILDEGLTVQATITPPPPAGEDGFWIEQLGFSPAGELVAVGRGVGAYPPYRILWWSASGEVAGVLDLPNGERPNCYRGLAVLPDDDVVCAGGAVLERYSLGQGKIGDIAYPQGLMDYWVGLVGNSRGNLVLWGENFYQNGGDTKVAILDSTGTLVRMVEPAGGWRSDWYDGLTMDGAGSLYFSTGYQVEKYRSDGTFLWSSGLHGSYPGRFDNAPLVVAGRQGSWYALQPYEGRIQAFRALDAAVDTWEPLVALDSGLGDTPLGGAVPITGTVDDPMLAHWTLRALPGGDETQAVVLATGQEPISPGTLAVWDTAGSGGDWLLALEARDDSGNVGTTSLWVSVADPPPADLLLQVGTSQGRVLPGVRVYAFTEAGSYTGTYVTTDATGAAVFDPAGFTDGTYKFRIDYLGYPFWSEPIAMPGTSSLTVTLAEEPTTILVSQAGAVAAGVRVYLFSASGAYLGQYATTDAGGLVTFDLPVGRDYKVRADIMGSQYWSPVFAANAGVPNTVPVDSGGGRLTATVDRGDGTPLAGVKVYLFSATGAYLSRNATTDAAGQVAFDVSGGDYKLRCDYLGYQFWSHPISVASDAGLALSIPHRDVTVTVVGDDAGDGVPEEAVRVYLFTESGAYQGRYEDTDGAGQVTFRLPEKSYKLRADVLSFQYWSSPAVWTDPTISIPEGVAEVEVTRGGVPVEGVSVYVFDVAGAYLGLHALTGSDGKVGFRLPAEGYRFRADVDGSQYWSGDFVLAPDQVNPIPIHTGGGSFTLAVTDGAGNPIPGVASYLFDDAGAYLGESRTTDGAGEAGFDLSDGTYTFRTDTLGYSFWTDPVTVAAPDGPFATTQIIDRQPVAATVQRDYAGSLAPVEGAPVYLFTEAGTYLGEHQTTDASGHAGFDVPDRSYKVRADVLSTQYWSGPFTATDPVITIPEGQAEVSVTRAGTVLEGVPVYVFNGAGTYLQINETTDAQGKAYFWLPEGTYRFRADAQGSQYFANAVIAAHQVNVVDLSTGGGAFDLTVDDGAGAAVAGAKVYVFTAAGSFIGLDDVADAQGRVSFTLSDGDYRFRVDHLGYSFWTPVITVPAQLSDVFSIAHRDVTVTVESLYLTPSPLEGVRVYLFTEAGAYQSRFADTDVSGRVTFRVPDQPYQVRADYLGNRFWSDPFVGTDTAVTIDHGVVSIHATDGGADAVGARVYLFSDAGAYLGVQQTTDVTGTAEFMVPAVPCAFRVDHAGGQTWSGTVDVPAGQTLSVEIETATP